MPLPADSAAPRGAYVRFTPAREVVVGRSGGFTRLREVHYIEGRVTRESADSLWLVVSNARDPRGGRYQIPLGATAAIARDAQASVTFGGVPDLAGTAGRSMVAASAIAFVIVVAIPVLFTWLLFGGDT